ncbi:hypothetical protein FGADI_1911 [Fusarium gaditjirri]|uniref:Uncharacterized protein n=1 Tax=Fusarium gaditjirri TaxID=282569 RepID=A0A8H4TJJ4_9HYPO|nr:hypothetical protein FGADI_1911 [Fusarium gaditjirri]
MASTSSETEVFTIPPSSPSQKTTCRLAGRILVQPSFLELEFDESRFSLPNTVRGICCSARNVWYSNYHWPEQSQYKDLFAQASETWEKLAPEFNRIWNKIWRKSLAATPWTIELRLAGVHLPNEQRIVIKPSIWIRSTDEAIRSSTVWKKLQKEVRKLGLDSVQYASIFAEGGLISAKGPASVPLGHLALTNGIDFSHGVTLHTHVPRWTVSLSYECGEVCLTTVVKNGRIVYQEVSRIGGVLLINASHSVRVTSGHTMLLYFLQSMDDDRTTSKNSDSDSCSEKYDEQESSEECELVENDMNSPGTVSDLGYIDLEAVYTWLPVRLSGVINFIKQAEAGPSLRASYVRLTTPSTGPVPADFALVVSRMKFEFFLDQGDNAYNFNGRKNVSHICPDFALAVNEQEILVLLGNRTEASAGFLQPARLPFSIGATTVWTRKVRLAAPLGRGTSGSWVVLRDSGRLCGSIIAVFEREPYALMITAQALFSDIIKYSRNVRLVTLGSSELDMRDESEALVFNDLRHEVGFRSINKEANNPFFASREMNEPIAAPEEPHVASQTLQYDSATTSLGYRQPHTASNRSSMGNDSGSSSGSSELSSLSLDMQSGSMDIWLCSPEYNVVARLSFVGTKFNFTTIMSLESKISETYPSAGLLQFPDTSRASSALAGCGSWFDQPRHRLDISIG